MIVRILKLNEEIGRLTLTSLEENIVISGPKKEFITELLTTGIRFKDKILTLKDKNLLMENLYIALSGDYFRATKPEKEITRKSLLDSLDDQLQKAKKYFQPEKGEKPPEGAKIQRGSRGGEFYEIGNIKFKPIEIDEEKFENNGYFKVTNGNTTASIEDRYIDEDTAEEYFDGDQNPLTISTIESGISKTGSATNMIRQIQEYAKSKNRGIIITSDAKEAGGFSGKGTQTALPQKLLTLWYEKLGFKHIEHGNEVTAMYWKPSFKSNQIEKAIKGSQHKEHKYIKREGTAGGPYEYTYKEETVDPSKALILIDEFDDETGQRLAVKFDYEPMSPEWKKIKGRVQEAGSYWNPDERIWMIPKRNLYKLFESLPDIAISRKAKYSFESFISNERALQAKKSSDIIKLTQAEKDFKFNITDLDTKELERLAEGKVIFPNEVNFILDVRNKKSLSPGQIQWLDKIKYRFNVFIDNNPLEKKRYYNTLADKTLVSREAVKENIDAALLAAQESETLETPKWFKKDLLIDKDFFGYQKKGINWLLKVKSGILAFGTGLGKTNVAICASKMSEVKDKNALIFAPKNVLYQWKSEIQRYTNKTALVIDGTPEERQHQMKSASKYDFVITTYGMLQDENKLSELVKNLNLGLVISDEAHRLKSYNTNQSKNFERYFGGVKHKYLLTAHPQPNNPQEMFRMIEQVAPGLLGSFQDFKINYCETKEVFIGPQEYKDEFGKTQVRPARRIGVIIGYKNLDKLHEKIKPYVFSKKIGDVDVDIKLPPRNDMQRKLEMDDEQKKLMRAIGQDLLDYIRSVAPADISEKLQGKEKRIVLEKITAMSQVAFTPELVDKNYNKPSPKIQEAIELVKENLTTYPNKGIVLFTNYVKGVDIMRKYLEKEDIPKSQIVAITGDTEAKDREEIKNGFNEGRYKILISTDAGKEGANLQQASNLLIHLTSPWNPLTLEQREGRIYRIGQKNPVVMVRDLMRNSIETYIQSTLEKKQDWINSVVYGESKNIDMIDELSYAELREILSGVVK